MSGSNRSLLRAAWAAGLSDEARALLDVAETTVLHRSPSTPTRRAFP